MSDESVASGESAVPPSAPATQSPAISGQSQSQPATQAAPVEDRSNWVPQDAFKRRISETRESTLRQAQQEYGQREAQMRAENDQYRRQLQLAMGFSQPEDPNINAVKQQFGSLYPGLTKLESAAEEILALREQAQGIEAQNQHYWEQYGRQTVDRLYESAEKSMGAPLSDEGKRTLHSSFVGFLQSSPELTQRYTNDPGLVNEFVKMFTSSFLDPVRRNSTAAVQGRAMASQGLPQDTPGGIPSLSQAPKLKSLDERAAAGWALYNQNKP